MSVTFENANGARGSGSTVSVSDERESGESNSSSSQPRTRYTTELYLRSATSLRQLHKRRASAPQLKVMNYNIGLHQVLGESQITNIKKVFFKQEDKRLNPDQLRHALLEHGKVYFPDDEYYDLIFLRINIQQNGYVTWDEFVSHLILGFKVQEVTSEIKSLEEPINKKPQFVKSNHRHPINKIIFNFQVKADRSYGYNDGSYITLSHDGHLNYWSLDLHLERTVLSKSPDLTVSDTWVLCVVAMPDVSVVCTSSTERDLRFYDTSARKFELRVQIYSMEFAVCCLYYTFPKDPNDDCRLIMGDMGGNVRIFLFSPINRGPFRSKMGVPLLAVPYEMVEKGLVPGFTVVVFRNLHKEWVRQVEYYPLMNLTVSCSTSNRALVMRDISENRGFYAYHVPKGVWCFACADGFAQLATGGSDCLVRVWNPYVTKRPLVIFHGHHTGIIAMVLQDKGSILCSLAEDKCIKIWDVPGQVCMQTYLGLGNELGEYTKLTMFYNPDSRQLIIGGIAIAALFLRPLQNGEHTDGNSHSASVSVLLYNALFGIILTCGLDSNIIVWDPWSGKRISVVREAHTRQLHGEVIPVDITAGCFDPGNQYLLTGAYDGTLKTWNFNTGTCLRNMRIEHGCEVTGVCWVKGRILAIGWNRHVTEFADSGGAAGPGGAFCKMWAIKHTDDVLAVAARIPQTLATSTYNGELILWRLETGQPYKQFAVANPTMRVKITYDFEKRTRHEKPKVTPLSRKYGLRRDLRKPPPPPPQRPSVIIRKLKLQEHEELAKLGKESIVGSLKLTRKAKPLVLPPTICPIRGLAVRCMIFLDKRPMKPNVGSLLVALENGDIQVWSHHISGGFLSAFQAVHGVGDYVVSMCTDEENEFLFAGSTEGYVKTFLMTNFHSDDEDVHVSVPYYRLIFPFLWYRFFPGRALKALGGQTKPMILNSYKAHRQIVSGLVYINKTKILVSASADFSVRLWTLSGKYLGTLGTFKPWTPIDQTTPIDVTKREFTIPPDVKRVMSSTSQRVFLGEKWVKKLTKKQEAAQAEKDNAYTIANVQTYGRKLVPPILGNFVTLPEKTTQKFEIQLDTTFPYIPVYQHLIRPQPVELPTLTPHSELRLGKIDTESNLDFT